MKKIYSTILFLLALLFCGCSTINITAQGDVVVDAHKEIIVTDPSAALPLPLM